MLLYDFCVYVQRDRRRSRRICGRDRSTAPARAARRVHKVGRVTGGGEQAGAQQRLVHGATVDTLGGELAVNLREEPDRREDAVQLLAWAHPRLRVSHAAPSRRTVERLEWDSCQIDKI